MRSRLHLLALVGALATAADIGSVLLLHGGSSPALGLIGADIVALTLAAAVSYLGNRWVTFGGDPAARWVSSPMLFAGVALLAGGVDLAVLSLMQEAFGWLLVSKTVAVIVAGTLRWMLYRFILFTEVRRDLAQRVPRPEPTEELVLSVVVPAYNEGERIGETVMTLTTYLGELLGSEAFEVIVVDDGSTDDTIGVAEAAGAVVVAQDRNRGKGAAVRSGMLASRGAYVAFTDADLAYPASMLGVVLDNLQQGWDMVVGSRRLADSAATVEARRIRGIGGAVVNRLTHLVLLGHFRDTQCGIKGFRGDLARTIFARTRIDGFAFDVELFLIAEIDQLSLKEIPVTVANRAGSSVRLVGDSLALFVDLFRIRRWAGQGAYEPSEAQRLVLQARSGSNQ